MSRLLNEPTAFKEEALDGFVAAYGRYVRRVPHASGVMSVDAPVEGKVGVLAGGGSGHYPTYCGLVGPGLADAVAAGEVFTSPSAKQIHRCTKAISSGAGVLYTYGNYSGDVMNFGMSEMRCREEGAEVRTVLVTDDIASAPKGQEEERRGIAGEFYVLKVAGASAARGDNLAGVESAARQANAATRSMGVAFSGCTLPGQSEPLFGVEPDQMGVGLGIHGEPGVRTVELLPARGVAELLVSAVLDDAPGHAGSKAAVMLNGLGGTKYEELFVLYRDIHRLLAVAGLQVHDPIVGEVVTSLDMAGCSLTLMWLDDELLRLHDAPASSPAFSRLGRDGVR